MIAPPQDLSDQTSTTSKGVGAHQAHLNASVYTTNIACETCHVVPQDYNSLGHIDSDKMAEVLFSGLAHADSTLAAPVYNRENATCANTYCHGNFLYSSAIGDVRGNNKTVNWTKVGSGESSCGTCHGLPPQGHFNFPDVYNCYTCHGNVINPDYTFKDKSKHINGKVDL